MLLFVALPYLQEAIIHAGGTEKQLEEAVRQKRVIRAFKKGMEVFYFPRFEFARESLYQQNMLGAMEKEGEKQQFDDLAESQLGFAWNPTGNLADMPDPGKELALLSGTQAAPLQDVSLISHCSKSLPEDACQKTLWGGGS